MYQFKKKIRYVTTQQCNTLNNIKIHTSLLKTELDYKEYLFFYSTITVYIVIYSRNFKLNNKNILRRITKLDAT